MNGPAARTGLLFAIAAYFESRGRSMFWHRETDRKYTIWPVWYCEKMQNVLLYSCTLPKMI